MAFKLGKSSNPIIQGGKMKSKLHFDKDEQSNIPGSNLFLITGVPGTDKSGSPLSLC